MEPEKILVVPREKLFGENGERYFQGFKSVDEVDFTSYIDGHSLFLLRRETSKEQPVDAESDESFKQIIPYILFKHGDNYFVYQRMKGAGKEKGENRLFDKHSVGVGGHINPIDLDGERHLLEETLNREFNEEMDYPGEYEARVVGYLNDDEDGVGRVHFGVVYEVIGKSADIRVRETDRMIARGMMDVEGLVDYQKEVEDTNPFENWSKLVIDYLARE